MSGKRYFLDTNAIIALLNGNDKLLAKLNTASWVGISVISKLEFLSFPAITRKDISLFNKFISKIEIISLNNENDELLNRVIHARNTKLLKLPDSIIAASAQFTNSVLVTNDKVFSQIEELKTLKLN